MKLRCRKSPLVGIVDIPGSKSHTIRAVAIASLAEGISRIESPLLSADTNAAVCAYRAFGADIDTAEGLWTIRGTAGRLAVPEDSIDVGNSGTTLRVAIGSAALLPEGQVRLTGDKQIQRRPVGPLLQSLNDLGALARSEQNNGLAPVLVGGPLRGGQTRIDAVTSQFLSSLLLNSPLAESDCDIEVTHLNEAPYVHITLDWLQRCGIRLKRDDLRHFFIPGGQSYSAIDVRVPGDFSSATFFLAAGAIEGNDVELHGLDLKDPQGDKAVVNYLCEMGADIQISTDQIRVRPQSLAGAEIDMNATPDALPMMAVLGCFAAGSTKLVNVPQARLKESDRISVMASELSKLGARIEQLPDGLIIHESKLAGAEVNGHGDHRVVMALAIAGCVIEGQTTISTAEAIDVTFPTFTKCLKSLGGEVENI